MRAVLITGAAGGFGQSIAAGLSQDGLAIFATDQVAKQDIHAISDIYPLDVTDEDQVVAAFDAAERALGPVAVLIACAGTMPAGLEPARIADMSTAEWDTTFAVNSRGTFLCLREFLRRRAARPLPDSRVVLMSSVAAQLGGHRGSAAYVAAKSAVLGLTKIAAREAAEFGVTVNCVAAGPVRTPMFDAATTPESADSLALRIPLGRIGSPEDVTSAVRYLVSPGAGWVTGSTLDVNGGYRMQ